MSLQGPIFVVADSPVPELLSSLTGAGAFPIIETTQTGLAARLAEIEPAAIVLGEPPAADLDLVVGVPNGWAGDRPYVPILATADGTSPERLGMLICADGRPGRLTARLRAALRVRTLHATVLRRLASIEEAGRTPAMPGGDPLEDATVLVAGRGEAIRPLWSPSASAQVSSGRSVSMPPATCFAPATLMAWWSATALIGGS